MSEWCVVFEYEPDPECEPYFKNGLEIRAIEDDQCNMPIKGILREMPKRMPQNAYEFETYTNGYAKGNNDVIDKLHGKNGDYERIEGGGNK